VYVPESTNPAYQNLLEAFEQEFTYAFGGCTIFRGLDGSFLARVGSVVQDRISLIYTDTGHSLTEHFARVALYADKLRDAAFTALAEEAVLVAIHPVYHSAAEEG
jgi:hypothetical protein